MLTSDVKTTLCYTGFGNPSEEVILNWFVHLSLWLHALDRFEGGLLRRRRVLRRVIHFFWPVLGIAYLTTHMFALVTLGVNSFNQVLFGATIGFASALILNFWLKPFFVEL